jgi:nitroreductase
MTPDYQSLLRIVRGRRSIRRFAPQPVAPEHLERMLEAARWAPSASNRQPYRFGVVRSRATRSAMVQAVDESLQAYLAAVRPDARAAAAAYAAHFRHFGEAPLVLVPFYRSGFDLAASLAEPGPSGLPVEVHGALDAISSVSAAIMNLLLAAQALGLGACWMTGPLLAAPRLRGLLELAEGWEIAALIPVGHPAESPEAPPRRAVAALTRELGGRGDGA